MKMGNPCSLHRGEEGDFRARGSVCDLGSPWSVLGCSLTGARCRAVWKGWLQSLLLGDPRNPWLWNRDGEGEARLGRRDQLLLLLYKTCKVHPSTIWRACFLPSEANVTQCSKAAEMGR